LVERWAAYWELRKAEPKAAHLAVNLVASKVDNSVVEKVVCSAVHWAAWKAVTTAVH